MTDTTLLSGTESTLGVAFERQGGIAIATLDRPKALNALTLEMIRALDPQLALWAGDDEVKAVVIRGAGGRAFCAGGDVRAIWEDGKALKAGNGDGALTRDFFREEYVLNRRIHTLAKPWIALIDGITMGGGVGLSVPGSHRIVTDKTLFAMPETGIGLFPDVGGSWYLPRCPGEVGTFLALTGTRLQGADALYAGLATHYVPSERVDELVSALSGADWSGDAHAVVEAILASVTQDPGTPPLTAHRDAIDRCFRFDSVEEIFAALEVEGTVWAADTLKNLRRMSPTSLKVTLRQMRTGRTLSFDDAMTMEYRMSQAFIQGEDFYEGIRALLVDKDKSPRWQPDTLDAVSPDLIEKFFAPLGERDLTFPSS
jgi:enoyl-CoA hydratase